MEITIDNQSQDTLYYAYDRKNIDVFGSKVTGIGQTVIKVPDAIKKFYVMNNGGDFTVIVKNGNTSKTRSIKGVGLTRTYRFF